MTTTLTKDGGLIEGLARGDAEAIETLVARWGAWIHRVTSRLLSDPRDAEEATQDVLMAVVRRIDTFRGDGAFSTWLYRIATNAAYERLRARRARAEVPLELFLPAVRDGCSHGDGDWSNRLDDPAAQGELRAALERGIAQLPDDYRVVLVLRDVEGLTTEAVGDVLGLSGAAVKSRLHRARLFLRRELGRVLASPR